MQRSILCEACKVFEPIFEYQSPMHVKPEFLLLDIVLIVKTFGGEVGGFGGGGGGGGSFPPHPPVDETLPDHCTLVIVHIII